MDLNSQYLHIWHKRLAHASYDALQHINSLYVPSFLTNKNNLQACEICHKAKQTRLLFPVEVSSTTARFKLVHIDCRALTLSLSDRNQLHANFG